MLAQELGIGWLLTILGGMLFGAGGVIAYLYKMLVVAHDNYVKAQNEKFELVLAEKDRQNKELEAAKHSLKEIATEAVKSYLLTANHYRQKEGQPPIVPIPDVIGESQSPMSEAQRETAVIATLREKMATINRETGIAPREEENPPTEVPALLADAILATKSDVELLKSNIEEVPEKVVEKLDEKSNTGSKRGDL